MAIHGRGRGRRSPVGSRNIRKHIPWFWGRGEKGRDWSLSAPSDGLATAQGQALSARPSSRGILMLRAACVCVRVCVDGGGWRIQASMSHGSRGESCEGAAL